jgi:hypothetical protein
MKRYAVYLVIAAWIGGLTRFASESAVAQPAMQEERTTFCGSFTAGQWVNAYPPPGHGTQYSVSASGPTVSCTQAKQWAKNFISQHISTGTGASASLSGIPSGWTCHVTPDEHGRAFEGHCKRTTGATSYPPTFTWGPSTGSAMP